MTEKAKVWGIFKEYTNTQCCCCFHCGPAFLMDQPWKMQVEKVFLLGSNYIKMNWNNVKSLLQCNVKGMNPFWSNYKVLKCCNVTTNQKVKRQGNTSMDRCPFVIQVLIKIISVKRGLSSRESGFWETQKAAMLQWAATCGMANPATAYPDCLLTGLICSLSQEPGS